MYYNTSQNNSSNLLACFKNINKTAQELSQNTARTLYTALWPLTVHTSAWAVTYVAIDAISTVASILTRRNLLWPHRTFINIFLTVFPHVAWTTATHWSLKYHHRLSFCSCLQTLVPVGELCTLISDTGTEILKKNLVQWLQSTSTRCRVVGNHLPNYLPCNFETVHCETLILKWLVVDHFKTMSVSRIEGNMPSSHATKRVGKFLWKQFHSNGFIIKLQIFGVNGKNIKHMTEKDFGATIQK